MHVVGVLVQYILNIRTLLVRHLWPYIQDLLHEGSNGAKSKTHTVVIMKTFLSASKDCDLMTSNQGTYIYFIVTFPAKPLSDMYCNNLKSVCLAVLPL